MSDFAPDLYPRQRTGLLLFTACFIGFGAHIMLNNPPMDGLANLLLLGDHGVVPGNRRSR